jgi:arginyl-tRNA synthetase
LALWQRFRDLSIEKSKAIYQRMNVSFDVYSGESQYPVHKQAPIIKMLEDRQLLVDEPKDNGTVRCIDLSAYKLGKVVFQKPDGSLLYLSRDIAAALERAQQYDFDKMIYVVGAQQNLHFQQLFKILELIGFEKVKQCVHVNFGMVRGMSSRGGTAVFLEDILDTARDTNLEIMRKNEGKFAEVLNPEETADIIGISATFIQDLIAKRIKDYDFNYDRMLQSHGDTGAYLQFAHVRIASIMRKANTPVTVDGVDFALLAEPECALLVSYVADYPTVLVRAMEELEPSTVVQYALRLTHLISSMLEKMHVKHAPSAELRQARMLLFWAAKQTLENALKILSIRPLERM